MGARRVAPLGVLLASTFMTACQQEAPEGACGGEGQPACYNVAAVQAHCYVEQLRDQFRDGAFRVEDLPAEADPEIRDGAPVIVDFSVGWPGRSSAQTTDELEAWREQEGLEEIDDDLRDTCREQTSQADMVATYGELED